MPMSGFEVSMSTRSPIRQTRHKVLPKSNDARALKSSKDQHLLPKKGMERTLESATDLVVGSPKPGFFRKMPTARIALEPIAARM